MSCRLWNCSKGLDNGSKASTLPLSIWMSNRIQWKLHMYVYIYVCVCESNLSITLISEWTQQSKDPHLKLYGNSMWSQKFWSVRNLRRFSSVSLGLSVSVAICILSGSINPIFRMFLLLQSRIFFLHNRVEVIYRQWIEITKQVICRQRIEKLTDNSNS